MHVLQATDRPAKFAAALHFEAKFHAPVTTSPDACFDIFVSQRLEEDERVGQTAAEIEALTDLG